MIRSIITLMISILAISCKNQKDLPTVPELSLEKYAGKWYEIARLPNKFEKGLDCVSATYNLKENGKIEVLNSGVVAKNAKTKDIKGSASVPNNKYPGRLKVSFFWPFAGDYYVISLAQDYSYALVGDPSRKYLWILSRTKALNEEVYSSLLQVAKTNGFSIENIIKTKQDCS